MMHKFDFLVESRVRWWQLGLIWYFKHPQKCRAVFAERKESLISKSFFKVEEWFCKFFNTEFHGLLKNVHKCKYQNVPI